MNNNWRNKYLRYKTYLINVQTLYKERADARAYTEMFLSLFTVSIFTIFALRPTILTIAKLVKEIDSKQQTLEILNQKIDNIGKAQLLYDQNRRNISLLNSAVPDRPKPDVLSRQLESLTSKNNVLLNSVRSEGLEITGVRLGKVQKNNQAENTTADFDSYIVDFTVSAGIDNFQSLLLFLSDIENMRMVSNIDKISVTKIENKDEAKSLSENYSVIFPYIKK